MTHLLPYALLIAVLFGAALIFLYTVLSSLYQDFLNFSRRFRGVE